MKKGGMVLVVLMAIAFSTFAQQSREVDRRQHHQLTRIRQGLASGDLTRREAFRLLAEQRHIRRVERWAKADGCVTAREQLRLQRTQRHANRDIYRQRHDRQRLN